MIQVVLLSNNQTVIAQVYQVDADPGAPNCRLVDPFLFSLGGKTPPGFRLTPWMGECVDDNNAMVHPDKIITIRDPKPEVLEIYKKLIFIDDDYLSEDESDIDLLEI